MKRRVWVLFWLCLVGMTSVSGVWPGTSSVAYAQDLQKKETEFVLQRFRPSFDPNSSYNAYSGETMKQWGFFGGLWANFSYRPLTIVGKGPPQDLVQYHIAADIGGGVSLLDMKWAGLEAYISLPILIYGDGRIPNSINCGLPGEVACQFTSVPGSGVGDLGLALKYRLLDQRWQVLNLAIVASLTFPTGLKEAFYGSQGVGFQAVIAVSRRLFERWNLIGNIGVRLLSPRDFLGVAIRNEFIYRVGSTIELAKDRFELALELAGGVGLESVNANNIPLELLGGIRIYPLGVKSLSIDVGGGAGLVPGYGIPTFRIFAGISYAHREAGPGDADDDGVLDPDDKCPNQAGPASNQGCPLDSDGDGIVDIRDRCPKVPGPKLNQGCPYGDTDKDGVLDNEDQCPNKPGAPDNNGCPWPDSDGDGLKDNVDQCPKVAGPKINHGCPDKDRDGDTLVDRKDNCPDIPGPVSNKGCPKKVFIKVNRKTGRILLLEKVYFDTARATIKRRSYPVLKQVIAVLKSNPNIRLRIEGHTDSRGGAGYNKRLSQRRANSVRRFLIRRGNTAPSRLTAKGWGEEKPITTNKTARGRAKNRRVEFHIVQ